MEGEGKAWLTHLTGLFPFPNPFFLKYDVQTDQKEDLEIRRAILLISFCTYKNATQLRKKNLLTQEHLLFSDLTLEPKQRTHLDVEPLTD